MQSIEEKILSRIYGHGRGWAFSKIDFLDLAADSTIRSALSRLQKRGTIRRATVGIYYYPPYSAVLKTELSPEIDRVAEALARKHRWHLVPDGSTARNILGIDTQVPARYVFLSSGPNRTYEIFGTELRFTHRKTTHTIIKDQFAAALVQAIDLFGPGSLSDSQRRHLSTLRSAKEYQSIVRETRAVTSWVHEEIKAIAQLAHHAEEAP